MSRLQHLPTHPQGRPGPQPDVAFTIVISSGVTSSGLTLTPTEFEQVLGGGTAMSNTVGSGGQVTVMSNGETINDTVLSGGVEVLSGGVASAITVSAGGLISGAGLVDSGTIYGFGAGFSVGPTDDFYPVDVISSGGTTSAVTVLNGGELFATSSGLAEMTTVSAGGFLALVEGGVASGSTIANGGGIIDNGGVASATQLSDSAYAYVAGVLSYTSSAGSTTSATVAGEINGGKLLKGAELVIASGGLASSVLADSGGVIEVQSNGLLESATLYGATLSVGFGGVVTGLVLSSGASATFGPQGEGEFVRIVAGTTTLQERAVLLGLSLSSGGTVVDNGLVADGGIAGQTGTTVLAGQITGSGLLAVLSSGTVELTGVTSAFTGEVIDGGGKIELATPGALSNARLDFDNIDLSVSSTYYATYLINAIDQPVNGGGFAAPIVDFSNDHDRIDLTAVAFTSGATAKLTSDTLTVVDGAYTAKFTLSDMAASEYRVTSDGAGGTLIEAQGSATRLVEAAASFQPSAGGMVLSAAEMRNAGLDAALALTGAGARHPLA